MPSYRGQVVKTTKMEITNPGYEMTENNAYLRESPEYECIGTKEGESAGKEKAKKPASKHTKRSSSLKCRSALIWTAIAVNFLLVIGAGGVLYYYHLKFLELDERNNPVVGEFNNASKTTWSSR